MQPFIMSLSLCLLGFAVCVLTFAAAMGRNEEEEEETGSASRPQTKGEQFFLDELPTAVPHPGEPADTFLLQLRTHVRLEQEAARAFLDLPNAESLHAPTESPLWH